MVVGIIATRASNIFNSFRGKKIDDTPLNSSNNENTNENENNKNNLILKCK